MSSPAVDLTHSDDRETLLLVCATVVNKNNKRCSFVTISHSVPSCLLCEATFIAASSQVGFYLIMLIQEAEAIAIKANFSVHNVVE